MSDMCLFVCLFPQMWTNVMCRVPVSTSATILLVLSSASVTRVMSWHQTQSPAKVNTHSRSRTHTHALADWRTFAPTCLFSMQTSMNAVSPAICASTSAWTFPAVSLASVRRDISSRETGCVKVLYTSFSSFCCSSNIIASLSPVVPLFLLSHRFKDNKTNANRIHIKTTLISTVMETFRCHSTQTQKLCVTLLSCEFMCVMVFSEVDLYEAPGRTQRVSCYLFFLPPSLVRCRLYRGEPWIWLVVSWRPLGDESRLLCQK